MILLLIFIGALRLFPLWSGNVIAQATLHITLYVPPEPVTEETPEGSYGDYEVARTGNTVHVTAL